MTNAMGTWAASSAASFIAPSTAPGRSRKLPFPKSDINVNVKDHYSSKVYTSSSPVTGDVTITTRRDVPFDSIQILLLGHTTTNFDGVSAPQEVTHTFLKMVMPVPDSVYPTPRVLETGQTYTIPFNFVIPNQLTINACNHTRLSDQMQDHHVLLPPSVGGWERDDMAPTMARVQYTIKARVLRDDGNRRTRIMEGTQTLQVLPASPEQPPLNVTDKDKLYRMTKTKTLRKNILSTKLGRLTASAAQPSPAVLSPDGRRVMSHPMVHIRLAFDPESPRNPPPTITGVTAKLTAHTYFSSGPISSFPNLGEWNAPYLTDRRGQFFTSTPLPPVNLAEQPAWTPITAAPITRRDSGYGSGDAESGPEERESTPLKTAKAGTTGKGITTSLTIPLSLPTDKKTLVPTFHSCIASRVYSVQLTVQLSSQTLSLVVPLQIAVDGAALSAPPGPGHDGPVVVLPPGGSGDFTGGLPSFEEAAADEHLRPRVLHVPEEDEGRESSRGSWMFTAGAGQQVADRGGLPEYGEAGYRRRLD